MALWGFNGLDYRCCNLLCTVIQPQASISDRASTAGQYKHPAPHADSGVIGNDANIDKSKIEPLKGDVSKGGQQTSGLGDEEVDAARVQPLGGVREEIG